MQRVQIGSSVFKVSKPGFDTSKATADQLIFDAFANNAYNGIFIAGYFPASSLSTSDPQYNIATIAFGKTFAQPPQCLVCPQEPGVKNGAMLDYYAYAVRYNGNTGQVLYQSGVKLLIQVTTSQLVIKIDREYGNYNFSIGFLYAVMQF